MVASHTKSASSRRVDAFTPSEALYADAGVYASAAARVFARPHAAYFQADLARRRLIQLVAAQEKASPALAEALATWSARRIADAYLPNAPQGLVEALRKAQGRWSPADYDCLLSFLGGGGETAKLLRHAPVITSDYLTVLTLLPPIMRRTRIVAVIGSTDQADLFAKGVRKALFQKLNDPNAGARLAERLERARTTQALFRALIAEIGLKALAPPPLPGAAWLKPIASEKEIRGAALRFENCLVGRIGWLLCGHGTYYEVVGDEPAIVEIVRDRLGLWSVGEIRGHANRDISPALYARVVTHLVQHGAKTRDGKPNMLAVALAQAAAMAM
jgi:hypothetical protein